MSAAPVIGRSGRLKLAETLWGWRPTPGQAALLMCDATYKTAVCGRRWGKTESGAIDDLTSMLMSPGWVSMVVAPSRDQVMINYRAAKELLERVSDFKGCWRSRETPHPEIVFGDRTILYRTAGDDGKYIRGHGAKMKRIRVDEAAYIKKSVIEGTIQPMSWDEGAELVLQGTPFGKNYFYLRYRQGDVEDTMYDGHSRSFRFPSSSNPHLNRVAWELTKAQLGEDSLQWRCEFLAEFVDSASAVFAWDLIESCFYDPYDAKGRLKTYGTYMAGIDLARYSDYTVVSVAGFDRGLLNVCDMDRFNELDWVAQKARIYDMVNRYDAVGAIDATGEGDAVVDDLIVGEFVGNDDGRAKKRDGLMLEKVRISTNQIKRDLIDKLKVRMSQGLVKIPYGGRDSKTGEERWTLLVDELKYYTYTMTDSGRVTFAADAGYHDDCVMSLALLVKRAFGNFETRRVQEHYPPESFGWVCEQLDKARKQDKRRVVGV